MVQRTELDDEQILTLYLQDRASVFADLYAFFDGDGKELVRFLSVFAGRTIAIPSTKRIQRWFEDLRCYQVVSKLGGEEWLCEIVAMQMGLSPNRVREGFLRVKLAIAEKGLPKEMRR